MVQTCHYDAIQYIIANHITENDKDDKRLIILPQILKNLDSCVCFALLFETVIEEIVINDSFCKFQTFQNLWITVSSPQNTCQSNGMKITKWLNNIFNLKFWLMRGLWILWRVMKEEKLSCCCILDTIIEMTFASSECCYTSSVLDQFWLYNVFDFYSVSSLRFYITSLSLYWMKQKFLVAFG